MFVWLFVLHLLNPASLLQTFDIRCPDSSQWQFKEKGFCNRSVPDYYCLLDENRNAPTEFCRNGSEFFRPGYKFVVSGSLTGKLCSGDFFQPFKFWTNYSSECSLTKSNCSEEGQNNFNNGNSTSDRACRCDHTKGYVFVHKPNNDCFCYPAYEDCSCHFRSCGHDHVLTPDYQCVKTSNWTGNYKCSKTGKESTRKTQQVEAELSSMLHHGFWCQHLNAKDTYYKSSQKEDIKIFVFGICTALVVMCLSIVLSVLQFPKYFLDSFDELDDVNKNIPEYNRELNTKYINDWLDKDKRFSQTTASAKLEEMIKEKNCVLVVGGSGDGKTSLIRHLAVKLWLEEDYDIVPIVMVPVIIRNFYNADRKQVFVVDDFCGRDRIYETSVDLWVLPHYTAFFEDIIDSSTRLDKKDIVKKNIKILIACNSAVYKDPLFSMLDFYKQYTVSLSKWPLSDKEREIMIKNKLFHANMVDSKNGLSFPLLCKLSKGKFNDQIRAFFEKPIEWITKDINKIKEQQSDQFFLISLLVLFDNQFNIDWLDAQTLQEKVKRSIGGISSQLSLNFQDKSLKAKFEKSLNILEKTFVVRSDQTCSFVHDKIFDIAAAICGEYFFRHFVNFASSKFIAERYKLETIQTELTEMEMFIHIKTENETMYFDRLINDLENGDTCSFLHNRQLKDKMYRKKFLKHCREDLNITKIKDSIAKLKAKENNNASQKDKRVSPIEFKDLEDNSYYTNLKQKSSSEITQIGIPLIESVIEGYDEIVNLLIEMGSNINDTHTFGRSALYISAVLNYEDIVKSLITKNADISMCDHIGRSALYISCKMGNKEIVDILLESKQCKIEQCDDTQSTPLHAASTMGHDHVVKLLLGKNHKVDPLDNEGRTPLFLASECGHTEVVGTLIHAGSDLSTKNKGKWTPLFAACNSNKKGVAELLFRKEADLLLQKEAELRLKTEPELLLQSILDKVDLNGRSPLLIAANNGSDEVIQLLVDKNTDISKCDKQGRSALYLACEGGHETTVNILLQNGCSVNKCNAKGTSPLHVACVKGNVKIVETLLSKNASVNAVDDGIRTALHVNCDKGNIETLKLLLESENIIRKNDKHGDSPLHVACKRGNKEIVKLLVQNGAAIDHCNDEGKQPLHIACCEGHYDIVDELLNRHAEINHKDIDGASPLFVACKMGQAKITRLLLGKKAAISICDTEKRSLLQVARIHNHKDIVKALLDDVPDIMTETD